jgi:leader peptidase (prepilin peptidase)/N-methyltransferase
MIPVAALPLLGVFAIVSVWLTIVDVRQRLLPNRILGPAFVVMGTLALLASAVTGYWAAMLRSLAGGAALFVGVLSFALLRPTALGGGDVKLVALTGLVSGWFGWGQLVVGIVSGLLLSAGFAVATLVLHRGRDSTFALGPPLLAGAWMGILAGPFFLG